MFDYRQISNELTENLPERTKDVISRRFGLNQEKGSYNKIKRESLESIGVDYGITRERVRQIERDGLKRIKANSEKIKPVFESFKSKMADFGGVKREDLYLSSLGGEESVNHVFFLLSLNEGFVRFSENNDFHSFWALDSERFDSAQKTVQTIEQFLEKEKKPIAVDSCATFASVDLAPNIDSYIEVSKNIKVTPEKSFGLKKWPEINPRNVKDKAYMVFKKHGKPLHFREASRLIGEKAIPQTVHNELIKDERFVLIGRGVYALKEWGYESGEVKQVIKKIISLKGGSAKKEEIVKEVKKQRLVKDNTITQSLSNKKHFKRNADGEYVVVG